MSESDGEMGTSNASDRAPSSAIDTFRAVDWVARLSKGSREDAISEAKCFIYRLRSDEERSLAARSLPHSLLLDAGATALLKVLTVPDRDEVYASLVTGGALDEAHLRTFCDYVRKLKPEHAARVWQGAWSRSPHRERLERSKPEVVDLGLQRAARTQWRTEHHPYVRKLEAISPVPTPGFASFDAMTLVRQLGAPDWTLARLWAGAGADDRDKDYETAKMLSARAAEVAAKQYYEALGHTVEDVAAGQIDGASEGWKTHDLLLDGVLALDVKNARTTINGGGSYSEHAIPRFKSDRRGADVVITGVRSPYLKLTQLRGEEAAYFDLPPVLVLGECTRGKLAELGETFAKGRLDGITFRRPKTGGGTESPMEEFLPPWVFDSALRVRDEPEAQQYRAAVTLLREEPEPRWEDLVQHGINPLPLYLQLGAHPPDSWLDSRAAWVRRLSARLAHGVRGSLPRLFLTLLTDFLDSDVVDRSGYDPAAYRQFVFPNTGVSAAKSASDWHHFPLGIHDPLRTVESMIGTLERLWLHRREAQLPEVTRFQFTGTGILRGQHHGSDRSVTLIAYCGGWVEGRGRCGKSPLVVGAHQPCHECGYLVCDACGHCSTDCRRRRSAPSLLTG